MADVKDYPSFVPWCSGARIQREDQREIIADLEIGFGRQLVEPAEHAFEHGYRDDHTERLAAYWAEALGGPTLYSNAYGSETSGSRDTRNLQVSGQRSAA